MKTKKQFTNRILSLVLAIMMVVSMLPMSSLTAYAADAEEKGTTTCNCGTDDKSIHATNCPDYEAPENPKCYCKVKCTEGNVNVWCDICGFDYTACEGEGTVTAYGVVDTFTEGNLIYEILTEPEGDNPGTVSLSGCSNSSIVEVTIPDSVTDPGSQTEYTVTSIGDFAFSGCYSLSSVTIPASVTSIGVRAFSDCESLSSVTIPDSVTSIGDYAFERCIYLSNVTIGNSVTSIGVRAFFGCHILTTIDVDSKNVAYASDDGVLFTKDKTILVAYPGGKSDKYTIPDSVTSIGDAAFYSCDSLSSVTIGDSVTSIGESAFYDCSNLTSVTIGDSVTSIGDSAFSDCDSLSSVTIGDSVTSIGDYAFYYCFSLESITIPDSVTSIGKRAFSYCDSLSSVTIGDSVTSIGDSAFERCSSLSSVTIPDSVISIGEWAFYDCSNLTSVNLPCNWDVDNPLYTFEGVVLSIAEHTIVYSLSEDTENIIIKSCGLCGTEFGTATISAADKTYDGTTAEATVTKTGTLANVDIPVAYAKDGAALDGVPENAGNYTASITLGEGDDAKTASVDFEITPVTPFVATPPSASAITYGDTLSMSQLTNGVVQYSNTVSTELSGSFAWKNGSIKPFVSDSNSTTYTVVFTPDDKTNYKTVETAVTLTVNKAENAPNIPGNTISAPYSNKTVGAVTLPTGWAWQDADKETALEVGVPVKATAVYTGTDKGNYEHETVEITITRSTCEHSNTEVRGAKKATCTAGGYTGDTYCKDCGVKIASGTTTETLNHSYKDVKVTRKATTKKNGTMNQKCSSCGTTRNISIYAAKTVKLSTTSYTYNGKVKTPSVTVTDSKGNKLKNKTDYTVSYAKGRKNVGKYTVTITLKGKYSGTIKKTFTINPKTTSISKLSAAKKGFTVKWKKQQSQTTGYEIQYSTSSKYSKNTTKTVKITKNSTTSKDITKLKAKKKYYVRVRTYKTVKVNGKSTKIYSDWSKSKTVTTKK